MAKKGAYGGRCTEPGLTVRWRHFLDVADKELDLHGLPSHQSNYSSWHIHPRGVYCNGEVALLSGWHMVKDGAPKHGLWRSGHLRQLWSSISWVFSLEPALVDADLDHVAIVPNRRSLQERCQSQQIVEMNVTHSERAGWDEHFRAIFVQHIHTSKREWLESQKKCKKWSCLKIIRIPVNQTFDHWWYVQFSDIPK